MILTVATIKMMLILMLLKIVLVVLVQVIMRLGNIKRSFGPHSREGGPMWSRCRSVSLAIHSHVSTNNFIVMEMLVMLMLLLIDRDEWYGVGTGDIIADEDGNNGDMKSKANDNNCDH